MPLESKKVSPTNNLAFAYIKYSNYPSTEPCGTAALILVDIKNCPFKTILCFLFLKNYMINVGTPTQQFARNVQKK